MMKMLSSLRFAILAIVCVQPVVAQFKCTFSGANDAKSCTTAVDDSSEHCVWCSLGNSRNQQEVVTTSLEAIGFCVTESQAEAMEQSLPKIHCDRYHSDSDDDKTPSEDDDQAPTTDDDNISPNDDSLPDNYWTCLWLKDAKSCSAANCTWCDTKANFGICMTGPSADSAASSDWFTCKKEQNDDNDDASDSASSWHFLDLIPNSIRDPLDSSCVMAFLEDQTEHGCTSAEDQDGKPCQCCSILGGMTTVCLTQQQADMGSSLGVTCDATVNNNNKVNNKVNDPYDPSCLLAYLQDSTKDACVAAVDAEGNPCEFCTLQGALQMCLNAEQAEMGQQLGIECGEELQEDDIQDPYDPSCLLAFLQDQTKEACLAAVDSDGNPCEFCTLQGSLEMCLNAEQAEMGEQLGIECGEEKEEIVEKEVQDPYDPSCALAFLQESTKEACLGAVDSEGNPCEYCILQGALNVCLNAEQAEMGEKLGMECGTAVDAIEDEDYFINDPYDLSCALAYLQDSSKDGCVAAVDSDGNACEFCTLQGALSLCLNQEQAEMSEQFGITCDATTEEDVALPPDFFECLEHYQDDDCRSSHCTWCNTEVGMGFCLSPAAADATKECTFFDCEFEQVDMKKDAVPDIYDPVCLSAGMQNGANGATICAETTGSDGNPCVWCDAAGVFGLCLSSEQANAAGQFLKCNNADIAIAAE